MNPDRWLFVLILASRFALLQGTVFRVASYSGQQLLRAVLPGSSKDKAVG